MTSRIPDKADSEEAPTAEEVRARIDAGETGDKVDHPDPAASPLGTDDEAAGSPPTAMQRRLAMKQDGPKPKQPVAKKLLIWLAPSLPVLLILVVAFAIARGN